VLRLEQLNDLQKRELVGPATHPKGMAEILGSEGTAFLRHSDPGANRTFMSQGAEASPSALKAGGENRRDAIGIHTPPAPSC